MTEKRERWQSNGSVRKHEIPMATATRCDGGQSSHDTWNSQPQVGWKEISAEVDVVRTTVKEKTSTWNKSCKEIAKSELELYNMVEAAVKDEKLEYKRKRDDQGSAAGMTDEMQRNLGEAQNRSYEVERKLDRVLRDYI